MSKFDQIYRKLILTKFFTKGWGNPENLKRILDFRKNVGDRDTCSNLIPKDYPVHIDKDQVHGDVRIMEGHFLSPFTKFLPGIMPEEVETANFQVILPKQWKTKLKPICLQLAGTGDHYFWRRRTLMARPLLKEGGIASIILENPFYGERKPKYQLRSSLHNVSDLFVMGGALILESIVLFNWCERHGLGPLGLTGISMGGHMASLAACNWNKPVVLVPCLAGSSASCVFTEGVMSGSIPWDVLQSQYYGDAIYTEELKQLITSQSKQEHVDAYTLGQNFVKNYQGGTESVQTLHGNSSSTAGEQYLVRLNDSNITDINSATSNIVNMTSVGENNSLNLITNTTTELNLKSNSTKLPQDNCQPVLNQLEDKMNLKNNESVLIQENIQKNSFMNVLPRLKHHKNMKNKTAAESAQITSTVKRNFDQDVLKFMIGVMDECTYLGNFSKPVDTSLIIIVHAKQDAYIPRGVVPSLEDLWPGSEVRFIDSGHVVACAFQQDVFRKAIIDAFDKQIKKYYS